MGDPSCVGVTPGLRKDAVGSGERGRGGGVGGARSLGCGLGRALRAGEAIFSVSFVTSYPQALAVTDLEASIRHDLARVLEGQLPLPGFTGWCVAATWDADPVQNRGASDLTSAIALALAKPSGGLLTRDALMATLRDLSRQLPFTA